MAESEIIRLQDQNDTFKRRIKELEDDNETLKSRIKELEEEVILPSAKYPLQKVIWEKATQYHEVQAGDHVAFLERGYWHHAIVEKAPGNQEIILILWSLSPREIVRRKIKLEIGCGIKLERAVYLMGCYDNELVVKRAQARLGEQSYNFFTNFARAFPEWCKTGTGSSTHNDKKADNRYKRAILEQRESEK